jgi:SAM-dependent methyltransferase
MHTLGLALLSPFLTFALQQVEDAGAPQPTPVETLQAEAQRVLALVECKGTKAFLAATRALPAIGERTVLYDQKTREALTTEEHAKLSTEEQARFQPTPYDGEFYYTTRYGTPIAYARALDVLGKLTSEPGVDALSGKRVLDFGYGGIGHLRLLASLGCDAVGVDVDPLLHAYYRAEDQGEIAHAAGGPAGRLKLVHGRWPAEERVRAEVGGSYDLVLSKNVLKKGYVRPAQKVDPRMLVDLGVPPEQFLAEVGRILKPGGIFALYNLCPAPSKERYIPWAYGESPFTKEEFAAAGFELLAFDVDDRAQAQELGFALKWDEQGMDLENDLFAWYTIARRRPG